MTNIAKGECRGKRKSYFRIGSAEPYPIFYKYTYILSNLKYHFQQDAMHQNSRQCRLQSCIYYH